MEESPLDKISWSDFVYSMSVGWEMGQSFMGKRAFGCSLSALYIRWRLNGVIG